MNPTYGTTVDLTYRGDPLLHQPMLVPVDPACRVLGVGRTKLYELVASGHLTLVKIGAKSLITAESLRRFVACLESSRALTER